MTKPRFNLALMPRDEDITEALYSHAHILRKAAAGYCIAPNKALAHVTLCQFRADDDMHAKRITDQFIGTACQIRITGLYQRPYPADPALLWFGYSVQHDEHLMALQHSAHQSLTKTADSVLTGTAHDYDPHFTLARIHNAGPLDIQTFFTSPCLNADIACSVHLGRSDENGQYLETVS